MAAVAAQATTFPGTNGRIGASGPISTHPLAPTGSYLELFTLDSTYVASAPDQPTPPAECKLTDNDNSDFNPRFSKDGRKVVYVKDNNLWTLQLDSQGKCAVANSEVQLTGTPVTALVGGDDSYVGGWCTKPNGEEWVVFQRNTLQNSFEVFKVQVNATSRAAVPGTETNLTNSPGSDSQPAVTPDCSKIAFHSKRDGDSDIHVMNFDGAGVTNRTNCSAKEESAPSWSPSADANGIWSIVFQTDRDTVSGQGRNLEIYKMKDVDTTPVDGCGDSTTRLSYGLPLGSGTSDLTGFDLNPAYSPDGTKICFHSGRGNNFPSAQWDIYVLAAANGEYHATLNASGSVAERKTYREKNDERCGWQEDPAS